MKIKSIVILLSCLLLLSGLTLPATACCEGSPPGNLGCYECEGGVWVLVDWADCGQDSDCTGECHDCFGCTCIDDDTKCDDCYSCESGDCVPCKCWDDDGPIVGSISVQDAKLCEQITHTSSISDTDHWLKGGGGEGSPTDTITYSWTKTAGTNPETGTFVGETNEPSVLWEAPPCTGTVTIKLTANDKPNTMDNPCFGSERDDSLENFEGTSTVSLPTGCDDCDGDPEISLVLNGIPSTDPSDCSWGGCGYADEPTNLDILILTPCYDGCTWRFGVIAIADVYYGPCLDDGNYTPIESGDDSDLTEDNYCEIVDGFDYNPSDESTGTGCSCVGATGEGCEGGTQYSSTECLFIHEEAHFNDFKNALEDEEELLATDPAFADMLIDCSDPDTKTCSDAMDEREAAIIIAVEDAYDYCYVCNDEVARAAANDCFTELANAICVYALDQEWESCEHCW